MQKVLSEKEISNKHIFKMPWFPLVSGIPGCCYQGLSGGATLTETVFAFPGMGKMLIDSVKASNNSMVVWSCLSSLHVFLSSHFFWEIFG